MSDEVPVLRPVLNSAETLRHHVMKKVVSTVESVFPIEMKTKTLTLTDVQPLHKEFSPEEQKHALMTGGSLAIPVKGTLTLKDLDGKVLDQAKNFTLMHVPYFTERHTLILDGNEYQVANMLRRKPGVYTQRSANGELTTLFNLSKGKNFYVGMNPEKGTFHLEYGTSKIPLYPVLRALGVPHADFAKFVGDGVADQNKAVHGHHLESATDKLYKKIVHPALIKPNATHEEKVKAIEGKFDQTAMDGSVSKVTLGTAHSKVTPLALLEATKRLLHTHEGKQDIDDSDSLGFKTFHSVDDFFAERMKLFSRTWLPKAKMRFQGRDKIREAITPQPFTDTLKRFVTTSTLAAVPTGINPIELLDHAVKVTTLGEGGIPNERAVPYETRMLHPTQYGVIDLIRTPECVEKRTEIYTKKGWKFAPDLTGDDELACLIDGTLEFHKPLKITAAPYKGVMYGVNTGKIAYLVTPNHRVYYAQAWNIYPKKAWNANDWRISRADEVHGKNRVFATAHKPYVGHEVEYFDLPKVESRYVDREPSHGGHLHDSLINIDKVKMTDWASFMGWFLAEGSFQYVEDSKQRGTYITRISQSSTANPEKCAAIKALLERMPFGWCYSGGDFCIRGKQLAAYVKQFGFCYDKYIPEYFFDTSVEARTNLLETLMLGDGRIDAHRATGKSYKQEVFCTTSPQLALDVERLAISLGRAVRTRKYQDKREERYLDIYEVRLMQNDLRQAVPGRGHYFTEDYDDMVYCPTVPGGLIYIRREGLVPLWSGNSSHAGVDLRATVAAHRDETGHLYTPVYDVKKKIDTYIQAGDINQKVIAFPHQKLEGTVDAFVKGKVTRVPVEDAQYQFKHYAQTLSPATSLIPFLHSTQGNRSIMGAKMQTQSLPLVEREAPYVQVKSHSSDKSYEHIYGHTILPTAPVDGTVEKIEGGWIHIRPHGVEKKAAEARTLYSYVPTSALDAILKDGLHSGKSLLDNPASLKAAAKGRGKDPKDFEKEIRENLGTWKRYASQGPNAVFHLIPSDAKLLENHPTKTNKLTPIAIDVDALMRDQPDTKFYGMELKPYEKSDKPGTRHHYIDDAKMRALHAQTPAAYWSTYNDIEKKGLYAPDVPHVAIHTPTGHVPAKYLKSVESTEKKAEIVLRDNEEIPSWAKGLASGGIIGSALLTGGSIMAEEAKQKELALALMGASALSLGAAGVGVKQHFKSAEDRPVIERKPLGPFTFNIEIKKGDSHKAEGQKKAKGSSEDYGHLPGYTGPDGDSLDFFVGNDHKGHLFAYDKQKRPDEKSPWKTTDVKFVVGLNKADHDEFVRRTNDWNSATVRFANKRDFRDWDHLKAHIDEHYKNEKTAVATTSSYLHHLNDTPGWRLANCNAQDDGYELFSHNFNHPLGDGWHADFATQDHLGNRHIIVSKRDAAGNITPDSNGVGQMQKIPSEQFLSKFPHLSHLVPAVTDRPAELGLQNTAKLSADADDGLVKVPYQDNFPFPSKTYLHHTLEVKPGDKVTKGQRLADSNFTRDGVLALGKNLRVAYMAWHGLNSNDAVVISESCAKKLTSEHVYREVYPITHKIELNKNKHHVYYGAQYTPQQYAALDEHGIVKVGSKVNHHDLLVAGLSKAEISGTDLMLGRISKALTKPYREVALHWEHGTQGEVAEVVKTANQIAILIKTREQMQIGDKLAGRYGNKGVVAEIVPDAQMVRDEGGNVIDVIMTSAGVVSRINPGQIVETAVGKVAHKTGKPIVYNNAAGHDTVQWAKDLLKEHGIKDKETLYDPTRKRQIKGGDGKGVFVGHQFIFKLFKSTETNFAAHGVGPYDINEQPSKKGGEESPKGLAKMEFDALVAHDVRNILNEASTIRSQKNEEFWKALQLGQPLPVSKPAFVFNKFTALLEGAGVKMHKEGSKIKLLPKTDKDILAMSSGAILNNKTVSAKNMQPENGGLFDPLMTGGPQGTKYSHIPLFEPMPNPVFEEPIRRLLGLTQSAFQEKLKEGGGAYFKKELAKIDVPARIAKLREEMKKASGATLNDMVKQVKALQALQSQGLAPQDAYVISHTPVVPPMFRPIIPMPNDPKQLMVADANKLYAHLIDANTVLKSTVLESDRPKHREHLYNAVGALFGTHEVADDELRGQKVKGFLTAISGQGSPKGGFFQRKIMRRTQDVSGRGTAVPDVNLNMDQVGLPEDMLWQMYDRFLIARLIRNGYPALLARDMVTKRHPAARDALMQECKERPVYINRAPTLHRYSIVSAFPMPVQGKTIRVNPFIEQGMNLDYDGDALQVHAPVTAGGVTDSHKMLLSNQLMSDQTRDKLIAYPQHEAILGVIFASQAEASKSKKEHTFDTHQDLLTAWRKGDVGLNDNVKIKNPMTKKAEFEEITEAQQEAIGDFPYHWMVLGPLDE